MTQPHSPKLFKTLQGEQMMGSELEGSRASLRQAPQLVSLPADSGQGPLEIRIKNVALALSQPIVDEQFSLGRFLGFLTSGKCRWGKRERGHQNLDSFAK